jgi:hypothetical protein
MTLPPGPAKTGAAIPATPGWFSPTELAHPRRPVSSSLRRSAPRSSGATLSRNRPCSAGSRWARMAMPAEPRTSGLRSPMAATRRRAWFSLSEPVASRAESPSCRCKHAVSPLALASVARLGCTTATGSIACTRFRARRVRRLPTRHSVRPDRSSHRSSASTRSNRYVVGRDSCADVATASRVIGESEAATTSTRRTARRAVCAPAMDAVAVGGGRPSSTSPAVGRVPSSLDGLV